MSPILDVDGHPYPGAFRRRLLASPWWRARFPIATLVVYLGVQILVMGYGGHQRAEVQRLLAETNSKVETLTNLAHQVKDLTQQQSTFTMNGGSYVSFPAGELMDIPLEPATQEQQRELTKALDAWTAALGPQSKITRPRLMQGSPSGSCESGYAIACANTEENEIVLSKPRPCRGTSCDLETVLMHEIGHLLGVPHISGDPLMDGNYQGKLDRPSVQAVALARVHLK